MNIERKNMDALNAVLTVKIEKADYQEKVANTLKEHRRKMQMPGFRPGMVPMGMVKKMYGKSVLVDEVLKLMSEAANKYIQDNNIRTLGEPLPSEKAASIDFDTQTDFEFTYDMAIAPELDLTISSSIKLPLYTIEISEEEKKKRINGYLRHFGKMSNVNNIELEDLVVVDAKQEKEGGHTVENVSLSLKVMPEKKQKKLLGLTIGSTLELDIRKTLTNDADCAAFLKVTKEELEKLDPKFTITVKEIRRMEPAEINQELFDKVYGEGTVHSEAEFTDKIVEEIRTQLAEESDYRFSIDARKKLLEKTKLKLPEKFLKRWMLVTSEGKVTEAQVTEEYPKFAENLCWQLIIGHLLKQQNMEVVEDDLLELSKKMAAQQFAMYGMHNMPEEHLLNFAKRNLERPEDRRRVAEQAAEQKIVAYIKANAKLEEKKITTEKFNQLFEKDTE
ncbi:MAG: trigger factor [Bacteroidales bacterium]